MGIDVVVAHQASYYNPYLDVPFYWLATHTRAWIALAADPAVFGNGATPFEQAEPVWRAGLSGRAP